MIPPVHLLPLAALIGSTGPATQPTDPPRAFVNSLGMKLVYIAPGRFLMGSPEDEPGRDENEGPQHWVTISRGFYIGAYEVTQGQFMRVMRTHLKKEYPPGDTRRDPAQFKEGANRPMERVEWHEARKFCKLLSAREGRTYRLPTEAEWEYACRAGTTSAFAFGRRLSTDQANFDGTRFTAGAKGTYRMRTTRVGAFPPNAWGLYDMHGNVWEWCHDWYRKKVYRDSPATDPAGPRHGANRVIRGGAWNRFARGCRSADRGQTWPGNRLATIGFRVVCEDKGKDEGPGRRMKDEGRRMKTGMGKGSIQETR